VLRVSEGSDLIVGGGRRVEGRCIIPIVRAIAIHGRESAVVSLTPVALIVAEGENEYLALLPGVAPDVRDAIDTLRDDIERQKEECAG